MMNGPLKIDPERIHILDSNDFTRLYNDLLRAEAGRRGIPQHCVDTTVRDKAPDGGVDCRVTDAPAQAGSWIPAGGSVHQLKGGAAPSLKEVRAELAKPEAQAAIARGDAYVLAIAEPLTARRKKNLLDEINNEYTNRGLPPRGAVYTADALAHRSEQNPAIAVRVFGLPIQGWYAIDYWEQQAQYGNEFISEDARTEVINRIRQAVAADNRLIRIVGPAGAGKSRTVLEAVRLSGIRERVLYAPDAAHVSPEFFWYLTNQNAGGSGVLVIDEATGEEISRIRPLIELLPPGYTVVAVGPLQFGALGGASIEVPILEIDTLDAIIASLVPAVPDAVRRAIARRCGGSPKLAVLIGNELAHDPSRWGSWQEVERSTDVVEYLNHRTFPLGSNDPGAIAMRAVSLFTRLGWYDELASEGHSVVNFLGGNWQRVRIAAESLVQRGVLSPRGRYLYPTPDVLANYLTRETLRAYGATDIRPLFVALSEGAQRSFAERLRQLGDEPGTRDVVLAILGETGFFRGLADLNDPRVAGLLHQLVPAFPELTLRQLERTLGARSREELLALDTGRRHIVWALEELAWWEEHFPRTARLIQRLAWAETETVANNATGIWQRLFQPWLGGTSAPFALRLQVLDEVLAAPEPSARRLGVRALRSALQTRHIMRFGGPPENTGMLPPREWQPSGEEWTEIIRTALLRLGQRVNDPDEEVRIEVAQAVAERASELIRSGYIAEWVDVARELANMPFDLRKPVLDALGGELSVDNAFSPDDRTLLESVEATLQGGAFADRLRRVVSSWDYELERYGREHGGTEAIDSLVREILASPEIMRPELPWLVGGDASSGWVLGKRLGINDHDSVLQNMMIAGWDADVRDERFLAGYFAGAAERLGGDWLERMLDQWVMSPSKAIAAASVTWHALSTDRAARRLAQTIRAGWVPASFLGRMIAGFWASSVSEGALGELIDAASSDQSPSAISGRVVLLAQYLGEYPDRLLALGSAVSRVLEEGATTVTGSMDTFYWAKLARLVLENDPIWVAQLCIAAAHSDAEGRRRDDEFEKVLQEALEKGGWDVFETVIGPSLLADRRLLWTLSNPFRKRALLQSLNAERLCLWIAKDPESRLGLAAHSVPVVSPSQNDNEEEDTLDGCAQLSTLARTLLVRFGDRDEVRSSLAATLLTGVWRGPESERIRNWIAIFERWAQDPDPNVRAWALDLADDHRKGLPGVLLREQEEI